MSTGKRLQRQPEATSIKTESNSHNLEREPEYVNGKYAKQITGHPVVDAIGVLDDAGLLYGPIVPHAWNNTILDERGHPHRLAILILAEIVSWYKPGWDHKTGDPKKKFQHDLLSLSRHWLKNRTNASYDAISAALTYLDNLGAIEREYRDVRGCRKSLFLRPVPKVIESLSKPEGDLENANNSPKSEENADTSRQDYAPHVGGTMPPMLPALTGLPRPDDAPHVAPLMPVYSENKPETKRQRKNNHKPVLSSSSPAVTTGASPPDPQQGTSSPCTPSSRKPSPAKGATRPEAGQAEEDSNSPVNGAMRPLAEQEARRFLDFFRLAHSARFQIKAKIIDGDLSAVASLIQSDWTVLELSAILLAAWDLIGREADNGYQYPCCQHSQRPAKFVQHFSKILNDTQTSHCKEESTEVLLTRITGWDYMDMEQVEDFFSQELDAERTPISMEDMPEPEDENTDHYIQHQPDGPIPFDWMKTKFLPWLESRRGQKLADGKREFLIAYWQACHRHFGFYTWRANQDYKVLSHCKSTRFDNAEARAKMLALVETVFKDYRTWEKKGSNDLTNPLWPILSQLLADTLSKLL